MTIVLYSEAKDRCHRRKAILARHVRRQRDPEDLDGNSSETRGMPERATKHVHTNRHTYVRTCAYTDGYVCLHYPYMIPKCVSVCIYEYILFSLSMHRDLYIVHISHAYTRRVFSRRRPSRHLAEVFGLQTSQQPRSC